MSSKFLAKTTEVAEPKEGRAFNVLSCICTSEENCYDSEQPKLTSAMETKRRKDLSLRCT